MLLGGRPLLSITRKPLLSALTATSPLLCSKRSITLFKKPDFSKLKVKDDPPGHIIGTVNEAFVPPPADYYHGSYHWSYEKIVTFTMIPLIASPIIIGFQVPPAIDALFGTLLLLHCRAGFQSCIIDYVPVRKFGVWHRLAMGLLTLGTVTGIYGVYVLETEENGIFNLLHQLWVAGDAPK